MEVIEMFQKGGEVMYLLLICSVAVAAIFIERLLFYRRAEKGAAAFIEGLRALLAEKSWKECAEAVKDEKCAAAFVAGEGIAAGASGDDVALASDTAYMTAASELRARLNYLSMIVTLAPLLGLLGTIAGMITSFNIFSMQAGQPLAITGGIGEALIATATGLCVAIFALVVHTYLAQRMDKLLTGIERAEAAVLAKAKRGE